MSYTEKIREHFIEELPKPKERRELMLLGLLVNASFTDERVEVVFASPFPAAAVRDLARLTRNITAEVTEKPFGARREYRVKISNAKFCAFIKAEKENIASRSKNAEDFMYYARGVFLASGRVSAPEAAESQLEFTFKERENAESFRNILVSYGFPEAGISKRRDKTVIYFKSRDKLCDILTAMDAGSYVFEYLNSSIYKSIEWNERRAINFISGNIRRTVIAGEKQTSACRFMLEYHDGAHLSPELYTTAVNRVNNPTLSLSELASVHTPQITKSGLNHRLAKISELAKKYGFEDNQT